MSLDLKDQAERVIVLPFIDCFSIVLSPQELENPLPSFPPASVDPFELFGVLVHVLSQSKELSACGFVAHSVVGRIVHVRASWQGLFDGGGGVEEEEDGPEEVLPVVSEQEPGEDGKVDVQVGRPVEHEEGTQNL